MKQFQPSFIDINFYLNNPRKPDFNNLLKVLHCQKPDRPTLFEFFMNDDLLLKLSGKEKYPSNDMLTYLKISIDAFKNAGYDYCTLLGSDYHYTSGRNINAGKKSISINEGAVITDRESFENYCWPDPEKCDYSRLEELSEYLPKGMKLIVFDPNGLLETVIELVGYETLCYILADDEELFKDIIDAIGSRHVKYFEICASYDSVGALISSDDWGFNTQMFFSADIMRKYIFPWQKKIVKTIHKSGKPAILHSCGNLDAVMDDIIDNIKFDAKHSFEDNILSVEKVYDKYGDRIAILGGIDIDYICRSTPQQVYNRAVAMMERAIKGGYALGSGNSIPYYVPLENFLAMIAAVNRQ
jgi:uroporphyrinogen decarboxylase